jgi:hypothetical protein
VCCGCAVGRLLPDCSLPLADSLEWSGDGQVLLYTTPDIRGRPAKVRGLIPGILGAEGKNHWISSTCLKPKAS